MLGLLQIQSTNPTFAEASATLLATQIANQLQKRPSVLEGDVQTVIDAITNESLSPQSRWTLVKTFIFEKIEGSEKNTDFKINVYSAIQWTTTKLNFDRIPLHSIPNYILHIENGNDPTYTLYIFFLI